MNLLDVREQIRNRLIGRKGEWPVIAMQSGVSHSAIQKIVYETRKNIGIETLHKLNCWLNGNPVEPKATPAKPTTPKK